MGRPDKQRKWRVSVFSLGVTNIVSTPMVHKASRKREIAEAHFQRYAAKVAGGEVGRVVLHQGNLGRGYSYYIHDDTEWKTPRVMTGDNDGVHPR